MFPVLFLLFVVAPLVELYVLVQVAQFIGLLPALLLLVLLSLFGAWLVRREGTSALRRLRGALAVGEMPTEPLVDGGLIVLAGTLCIVPGFLSDGIGLLLLVPPVRTLVRRRLIARWSVPGVSRLGGRFRSTRVIDVEYLGDVTPRRPGRPGGPAAELDPGTDRG
ncbi:MAG: FxsA family protein [Acidobacteria bacterium]|nr:FxsA family protein [Acidobacteriota bacterium]